MELTDTQLREKFQQWGKSSGVITDFAKCAPLPVSGARLYSRETNIAWQAFRDAYWSGHREAVLASIPEMGSGEQRFDARIGKLCTHRPAPAPAPALCHCYVDAPPHTHEPIPESAVDKCGVCGGDHADFMVHGASRPERKPESPPQDDAAVVDRMCRIVQGVAPATGSRYHDKMTTALIEARRRMVTLEAVEKAFRFSWYECGLPGPNTIETYYKAFLAALTAPKPPSKQERVK